MTWPRPKFDYGQHVTITPLDGTQARVVDLHVFGAMGAVEYDVRYFHDGREFKVRVFEDELRAMSGAEPRLTGEPRHSDCTSPENHTERSP